MYGTPISGKITTPSLTLTPSRTKVPKNEIRVYRSLTFTNIKKRSFHLHQEILHFPFNNLLKSVDLPNSLSYLFYTTIKTHSFTYTYATDTHPPPRKIYSHPNAYAYATSTRIHTHIYTRTCICIIAPKWVKHCAEEFIVSQGAHHYASIFTECLVISFLKILFSMFFFDFITCSKLLDFFSSSQISFSISMTAFMMLGKK